VCDEHQALSDAAAQDKLKLDPLCTSKDGFDSGSLDCPDSFISTMSVQPLEAYDIPPQR
jgi:hypothetical protein